MNNDVLDKFTQDIASLYCKTKNIDIEKCFIKLAYGEINKNELMAWLLAQKKRTSPVSNKSLINAFIFMSIIDRDLNNLISKNKLILRHEEHLERLFL